MSKTKKTMVSALMMPLYQYCKVRVGTGIDYELWWGDAFASYCHGKDLHNCVVSRYMTGARTIPVDYLREYADGKRTPHKLVSDLKNCIERYYKQSRDRHDLNNMLLDYAKNIDPLDQAILIPAEIRSSLSVEDVAEIWAKLLLYAMSMDMCRDLFRS